MMSNNLDVKMPILWIPTQTLIEENPWTAPDTMARAIGVPPREINEIVLGKRSGTPSLSIRFGAFFGQSEDFRHGIRVECDFRALRKEKAKLTAKIRRVGELVGGWA